MFNHGKLKERYQSDAVFNKSVNLFRQLIEQYGLTPHEIREGLFFAQYMYEMDHTYKFIRTQKEMDQAAEMLVQLRQNFILDANKIIKSIK